MTYLAQETSASSGQPIELYLFQQGTQVWRYSSSAEVTSYLGAEYVPTTIVRSDMTQTSDITRSGLSLVFPRDHDFAKQFLGYTPDLVTSVTIYRSHVTDTDNEFYAYWKGRVVTGKATGSELTLECESVFSSMRRVGLRARYQRTCRHTLYGPSCGVSMDAYKATGVVNSVLGVTISCTAAGAQPDGYYTGGLIKLESGAMRFITYHQGAVLTISRPFIENIGGQTVDIFPGCDHLKSTCISKFNNLLNFGGFPYIPNINPFGGTSIV